ncbi:MAG: M50 family metallopeptidase [Eubacteriales bacterium]
MIIVYLLLTLLLLGVLVLLHEGGHFLVARLNNVTVNEFAIGMGPKVLSWVSKKSGIRYSLRAFPIGGFVSMAGEDEESEDKNAFCNKNVWQRISVVLAGPLTNIIVGFLGMLILVMLTVPASNIVAVFFDDATSNSSGLCVNDKIIEVNGVKTHTGNEVAYEITYQGDKPLDLVVIRDGETIELTSVIFPQTEEEGVVLGVYDFQFYPVSNKDFGLVLSHTFWRTCSSAKMVWDSLAGLVSGRFGLEAVSGPIGMTDLVETSIANGWESLLYLWVIISVNLGVMNLLPVPALDGGRFIFLLWEAITRKPVNKKIEGYINAGGLLILMAFMLLITFKDVFQLFR